MNFVLFLLFFTETYNVGDAYINPIKPSDLQRIVNAVKQDVETHLKTAYADRQSKTISLPDFAELEYIENGNEYTSFMKAIEDSMQQHIVKNLGHKENKESTVGSKSDSEQVSTSFDKLEPSKIRIGSTKGVPGVNFPDYTDIPITTFTCSEKPHIPGFYADLDTGCQVFHVCWDDKRETFLCPIGTTFNQALRVCDYWYNSNCSLAPYYYSANAEVEPELSEDGSENVSSMINTLFGNADSSTQGADSTHSHATTDSAINCISEFMPIKVKIVVYPKTETKRLKIVTSASIGEGKKSAFDPNPSESNNKSKHSRRPRFLENKEFTKDADAGSLPLERLIFRLYEVFDRAVMDIENDETWSGLSEDARKAVNDIKSFLSFFTNELLENIFLEPGSKFYEEDIKMRKLQENLREVWKYFLTFKAHLKERYRDIEMKHKKKYSKYLHEQETLKPETLTNLNPRFIVKPTERKSNEKSNELPKLVKLVKSATISNPLSDKERMHIHPLTKKILIKSYRKLFKTHKRE